MDGTVQIGRYNAITDLAGIKVGHYTNREAACGVTVLLCEAGAVAGVDVRGGAPCTRETDLLKPGNLVKQVQAVVLTGGSVYGLAAADGVVRWLQAKGCGFPLDETHVAPIVPAAAIFDLGRGKDFVPPIDASWGKAACRAAKTGPVEMGSVGAGTGAFASGIKGGLGTASVVLDAGITVAALVAANPRGTVVDRRSGALWERGLELQGEFGEQGRRRVKMPPQPERTYGSHTTIGVVATDAVLQREGVHKLAQIANAGLARAIRPIHTLFDGDAVFCLSTGRRPLPQTGDSQAVQHVEAFNALGCAAADCLARAVVHAVLAADSLGGMTAFRDLEDLVQ